jgi:radical SAM superfamily enzyme YgiQ (UPF0313 family)
VVKCGETCDLQSLPSPDFHFPLPDRRLTEKYRKHYFYIFHDNVALIKTAFGCPGKCTFCFCRKITGDLFAVRPLDDVLEELGGIREKEIYIVDDDFFASKPRLTEFLDRIEKASIKKQYLVYGRADFIAENPDLIRRFKNNGLRTVIVGLESFFDDELDAYRKKSSSSINAGALRILNDNNIDCFATVIVPPSWDRSRFIAAGDMLLRLNVKYVNLQPLTPLPGTDLHNRSEPLLIEPDDFDKWDLAHVSLKPQHMPAAAFYREIIRLYNRILFRPSVLLGYVLAYRPSQLWKMLVGTIAVRAQYEKRITAAQRAHKANHA